MTLPRVADLEEAIGRIGRLFQHGLAGPAGPRLVRPQLVLQLDHMRRGLHAVQIELPDPIHMLEDPRKLLLEPLSLRIGDGDA